jgi:hypothetical protein
MASVKRTFRALSGFDEEGGASVGQPVGWKPIVAGIVLILVTYIAVTQTVYVIFAANVKEVAACDDGMECTLDTMDADGTCSHRHKSALTKCSQCYASKSGHCDPATAECVDGAVADCLGNCDADNDWSCDNLWQPNLAYLEDVFAFSTACVANECTAFGAFMVFDGPYWASEVSMARCADLLDPDFYAANKSCIEMERYEMPFFSYDFGEDWQACIYRWTCAKQDQSWLNDFFGISSASERLAKQLGLSSASALPGPTAAALAARTARLAQIRENRANNLPALYEETPPSQ